MAAPDALRRRRDPRGRRDLAVPPRRRRPRQPDSGDALALHDLLRNRDGLRVPAPRVRARGPRALAAGRPSRRPAARRRAADLHAQRVRRAGRRAPRVPGGAAAPRTAPARAGAPGGVPPGAPGDPRPDPLDRRPLGSDEPGPHRDGARGVAHRRPVSGLRPRARHDRAVLPALPRRGRAALARPASAQQRHPDRGRERPLRRRRLRRARGPDLRPRGRAPAPRAAAGARGDLVGRPARGDGSDRRRTLRVQLRRYRGRDDGPADLRGPLRRIRERLEPEPQPVSVRESA